MKDSLIIKTFASIIWILLQIRIATCNDYQCIQQPLNQHRQLRSPYKGPATVQWSLNPCCKALHFIILQHGSLVAELSNPAGKPASLILYQLNNTIVFGMFPSTIGALNEEVFQINAMFDPYQCGVKRNLSEDVGKNNDNDFTKTEEYTFNVTLLFVVNNTLQVRTNKTVDYNEKLHTTHTIVRVSVFLPIPLLVGFLSFVIRFLRNKGKLRRNRKEHKSVIRRMKSNPSTSERISETRAVPQSTTSLNEHPRIATTTGDTKIELEITNKSEKVKGQEVGVKVEAQIINIPSDNQFGVSVRRIAFSESFCTFHSYGNASSKAAVKTKRRITYPQVISEPIALKELSRYVNLVCTPLVNSCNDFTRPDDDGFLELSPDLPRNGIIDSESDDQDTNKLASLITDNARNQRVDDLRVDQLTDYEDNKASHLASVVLNGKRSVSGGAIISESTSKTIVNVGDTELVNPDDLVIVIDVDEESEILNMEGCIKLVEERDSTDLRLQDSCDESNPTHKMVLERMRSYTL